MCEEKKGTKGQRHKVEKRGFSPFPVFSSPQRGEDYDEGEIISHFNKRGGGDLKIYPAFFTKKWEADEEIVDKENNFYGKSTCIWMSS